MDNIQQHSEIITSFSNPNYTLNQADALNSNFFAPDAGDVSDGSLLDELADTLQRRCDVDSQSLRNYFDPYVLTAEGEGQGENGGDSRRSPADSEGHFSMDSSATSPVERTESIVEVQHSISVDSDMGGLEGEGSQGSSTGRSGFTGFYASVVPADRRDRDMAENGLVAGKPQPKALTQVAQLAGNNGIASPGLDSNDSGIQADVGALGNGTGPQDGLSLDREIPEVHLPSGWQQCTDEEGAYYWHLKSGTIQRDPPTASDAEALHSQVIIPEDIPAADETSHSWADSLGEIPTAYINPSTSDAASHRPPDPYNSSTGHAAPLLREVREQMPSLRYAVRSLGWVPVAEEDLTQERSSRAVNKCIVDLSLGRNDINDGVGRWGDGKDLYLELDTENLTLLDTVDLSVLNVQPVQSIRVWGVGRDNGRDFAYVARDRASKRYMCHVFRCDTPARQIANNLRDVCQRIVMGRSFYHPLAIQGKASKSSPANRPKNLPNLEKTAESSQETLQRLLQLSSFPTPMEEPKKVIQCHYLGPLTVAKPTGIDVLNNAMEKVYSRVPPEEWHFVNVAVAPSTITISEHGNEDNVLAECRVRFLSFMGIAQRNVKLCSFIMHTAQDDFVTHVFHSEPSAGALCKTIEAACKLRYQKCLDAHQKQMAAERCEASSCHAKGLGASLKHSVQSVLGSISRTKKPKS